MSSGRPMPRRRTSSTSSFRSIGAAVGPSGVTDDVARVVDREVAAAPARTA